jgi:hypothetical protein
MVFQLLPWDGGVSIAPKRTNVSVYGQFIGPLAMADRRVPLEHTEPCHSELLPAPVESGGANLSSQEDQHGSVLRRSVARPAYFFLLFLVHPCGANTTERPNTPSAPLYQKVTCKLLKRIIWRELYFRPDWQAFSFPAALDGLRPGLCAI